MRDVREARLLDLLMLIKSDPNTLAGESRESLGCACVRGTATGLDDRQRRGGGDKPVGWPPDNRHYLLANPGKACRNKFPRPLTTPTVI